MYSGCLAGDAMMKVVSKLAPPADKATVVPASGLVLVVEDDLDVRESIMDALQEEGYCVAGATDGLDALAYLRDHPAPALILLDWRMPRCDGAEFLRLRQDEPRAIKVPVVLLTADPGSEHSSDVPEGSTFLQKPVELDDLLATVERFVRKSA
jgi:CheY-like chemotaxis protein